jgi:hypothetical protein
VSANLIIFSCVIAWLSLPSNHISLIPIYSFFSVVFSSVIFYFWSNLFSSLLFCSILSIILSRPAFSNPFLKANWVCCISLWKFVLPFSLLKIRPNRLRNTEDPALSPISQIRNLFSRHYPIYVQGIYEYVLYVFAGYDFVSFHLRLRPPILYCHVLRDSKRGLDLYSDLLHTYSSDLQVTITMHKSL